LAEADAQHGEQEPIRQGLYFGGIPRGPPPWWLHAWLMAQLRLSQPGYHTQTHVQSDSSRALAELQNNNGNHLTLPR
jgi:hypothetical protein